MAKYIVGDIVVCNYKRYDDIVVGKKYKIRRIHDIGVFVYLFFDDYLNPYDSNYFIELGKYRMNKIRKIKIK